jgi:hypothetical protein
MVDMPTKGKLVLERGAYYLEVPDARNRRAKELVALGANVDKKVMDPLVGTEVELVYSEPLPYIVGVFGDPDPQNPVLKRKKILCYKPVMNLRDTVLTDPVIISAMAKKMVDEGTISQDVYQKIITGKAGKPG